MSGGHPCTRQCVKVHLPNPVIDIPNHEVLESVTTRKGLKHPQIYPSYQTAWDNNDLGVTGMIH